MTAVPAKIRVFISSRIESPVRYGGTTVRLARLRADIHALVKAERLFGYEIFDPWISELTAENAGETAIARCLRRAADAHVFLAITNGEAGFVVGDGDNGICHAELAAAYDSSPDKVYVIRLAPGAANPPPENAANARFARYVDDLGVWTNVARDGEEVLALVKASLVDIVAKMTTGESVAGRIGARTSRDSLNWEALDLRRRAAEIRRVAVEFLRDCTLKADVPDVEVCLRFDSTATFCRVAAVPEALSFAPARDLVGQVFRDDHVAMPRVGGLDGPVHFVACHRGVTRSQARKLLGVEDATYIDTDFGVFMADEVQQVQAFLIRDCRDPTSTRTNLAACVAWLRRGAQLAQVGARARRRKILVSAMQQVADDQAGLPAAPPVRARQKR